MAKKKDNELTFQDTVDLMMSEKEEDNLVAEYAQLVLRKKVLIEKIAELEPTDKRSITIAQAGELGLLRRQLGAMNNYESVLKQRVEEANIE